MLRKFIVKKEFNSFLRTLFKSQKISILNPILFLLLKIIFSKNLIKFFIRIKKKFL
jgi:hypothetical protein